VKSGLPSEPRFPFVAIDVDPADADVESANLFELGAQGVEERDETTLAKGAPGKVTLVASFSSPSSGRSSPTPSAPSRSSGRTPG